MNLKREGANHGILEDLDNRNDNWGTLEQELDERYTKTESDTRFAPKQHTHEISDVNGLSDELESSGLTLVNLIENGDFSNGTSGWGFMASLNAILTVDNGIGKVRASETGYLILTSQTGAEKNNHLYYMSVYIRSNTLNTIQLTVGNSISGVFSINDSWKRISTINERNNRNGFEVFKAGVSVGEGYDVYNFIGLDLTQTFGAGNEPAKEEMDTLIETLGVDYFEEITVTKLQAINWLLKLIRQNALATTSLGGTIL